MNEDELKALFDSKTPQEGNIRDVFWNEPDTVQAAVNLAHSIKKQTTALFGETSMQFESLYQRETFDVMRGNTALFSVTIREISTEGMAESQEELMKYVDMDMTGVPKSKTESEMKRRIAAAMKKMKATEYADRQTIASIVSWTLKDDSGADVGVSYDVWRALPAFITKQIEKRIEVLNPELDSEFQVESGSKDTK